MREQVIHFWDTKCEPHCGRESLVVGGGDFYLSDPGNGVESYYIGLQPIKICRECRLISEMARYLRMTNEIPGLYG